MQAEVVGVRLSMRVQARPRETGGEELGFFNTRNKKQFGRSQEKESENLKTETENVRAGMEMEIQVL